MTRPRMAEPKHDRRPKASLEQLIQLKRSERPRREFWEDFDRELHRRQLAELVKVEPWHQRAARGIATVVRRLAPMGAAAAALAFAAFALVRVGTPGQSTAETSETLAAAEVDSRIILLPEESISVSTKPAPSTSIGVEEFRGNVRSAPQELASGLAPARRFVAVSAPVTLASESDASAIYSARALTAGAVLRSLVAAAPESL